MRVRRYTRQISLRLSPDLLDKIAAYQRRRKKAGKAISRQGAIRELIIQALNPIPSERRTAR